MSPDFDPNKLLDIPDPFAADAQPAPEVPPLPVSSTRSAVRKRRVIAILAAIAVEGMLLGMMGLRGALTPTVVTYGAVFPVLGAGAILLILSPSLSPRSRVLVATVAAVALFALAAVFAGAPGDDSVGAMARCVLGGSMMAIGPLGLALYSMRHAFVVGVGLRTAALGVACGLLGAAALRLQCPNDSVLHVVVGHGLPIAIAGILAALVGGRLTRA